MCLNQGDSPEEDRGGGEEGRMQGLQSHRKVAVVYLITTARLGEEGLTRRFASRACGGGEWAAVYKVQETGAS